MIINRRSIQRLFFISTTLFMMVFASSSASLMASDLSETYKDGVRFELRLVSLEKVNGWERAETLWNQPIWVSSIISLNNSDVAQASAEERGDTYSISLWFTEEGTLKLARLAKANIGKQVAVMLNGRAVFLPKIIDEIISGYVVIIGDFTEEEARLIAEGIMAK